MQSIDGYRLSAVTAIVAFSMTLSGCASAPKQVAEEAARYLRQPCLSAFLDGRYQYVAMVNGRAAFALADDTNGQACGFANNHDVRDGLFINLPPVDRLEALALQRCESGKPNYIKAPCRLFARGAEIVWKK